MKTRLAHLYDLSDAARTYAIYVATNRHTHNLTTAQALDIAHRAEGKRAALTIAQAERDIEEHWRDQFATHPAPSFEDF